MATTDTWTVWRRDTASTRPDEWVAVDSGPRLYCENAAADRNKIAAALDPTVEFAATYSGAPRVGSTR